MKSKLELIKEAIVARKKLQFTYRNDQSNRTVYPHILYTGGNDAVMLDAYQTDGYSASGTKFPQWKQFDVSQIKKVVISTETFRKINSFNPKSVRYKNSIEVIK